MSELKKEFMLRSSDRLNPLLVREIRQSLRGNIFAITIALASLFCMVVVICGLLAAETNSGLNFSGSSYHHYGSNVSETGLTVFVIIFSLLTFLACLGFPLSAVLRFRGERSGGEFELFMITGIPVWRVIIGKLQSSFIQVLLVTAVAAPFMMVTYLLRGISILNIFTAILMLIMFSLLCTQGALFLGAMKVPKVLFIILLVCTLLASIPLTIIGASAFNGLFYFGAMSSGGLGDLLGLLLSFFTICFIYFLFFYLSSISILELPNKNRGFYLKIAFFPIFILIYTILYFIADPKASTYSDISFVNVFFLPFAVIAPIFLPMKFGVAPMPVRKRWKSEILKIFAASFYPGKGSYMMWLTLFAVCVTLVPWFFEGGKGGEVQYLLIAVVTVLAFWNYLLGGLLRIFMKNIPVYPIAILSWGIPSVCALFCSFSNDAGASVIASYLFPGTLILELMDFFEASDMRLIAPVIAFWTVIFIHGVILYLHQLKIEKTEYPPDGD